MAAPHAPDADAEAEAFAALAERFRPQLHLHCYRLVGSVDDADDLVQDTLLRAWRSRATFQGRANFGTWLYRIATNACLNALTRSPRRRRLPQSVVTPVTASTHASEAREEPPWAPDAHWLQPYPDNRLDLVAASLAAESQPETAALTRESVELAYLAALQQLPPRQRAVLILREVLDWSARETAEALETSVAAVHSAHQRARGTLRAHHVISPPLTTTNRWPSTTPARTEPTDAERRALQAFIAAWEAADTPRLVALLCEDARWAMPPAALWFDGRAAIERLYTLYPIDLHGRTFKLVPVGANRQPAAAAYVKSKGESDFVFTALHVLRVDLSGAIAEVITFGPTLCGAFDLPRILPGALC
ncbi:MAG TPA: RNA polymerase subunit sigma-70 [Chloroflexota bacterium]